MSEETPKPGAPIIFRVTLSVQPPEEEKVTKLGIALVTPPRRALSYLIGVSTIHKAISQAEEIAKSEGHTDVVATHAEFIGPLKALMIEDVVPPSSAPEPQKPTAQEPPKSDAPPKSEEIKVVD